MTFHAPEIATEMTQLVSELVDIASRADAVRLGNTEDRTFSKDQSHFLESKLRPFLSTLRSIQLGSPGPFFGSGVVFLNVVKIIELLGQVSLPDRVSFVELFGTMSVSYEPSMGRLHYSLCVTLWELVDPSNESVCLLAMRTFCEVYNRSSLSPILMDYSDFSNQLCKFVTKLRFMYASRMGVLLEEAPRCLQVLTLLFPSSIDTQIGGILGDMMSVFTVSLPVEAQVNSLTFVAYLSRRGELLRPFDQQIARISIHLLKTVFPIDLRRELVLSVRAFLHSEHMSLSFIPWLDDLFDETVFVGTGKSAHEIIRPIVVASLGDFTNAIKDKIPVEKIRKVFTFFLATMSDSADLGVCSQFQAARILLTLIDHLFNKSSNRSASKKWPTDGSDILREVLRAMVEKFSSLCLFVPKVIQAVRAGLAESGEGVSAGEVSWVTLRRLVGRANVGVPLADLLIEGVREIRSLVRTLLLTSKMVIHCLTHRVTSRMLTKSDVALIDSLLEDSLKVAHLFSVAAGFVQAAGFEPEGVSSANGGGRFTTATELAVACSVQEERDLIEQIASVLLVMPGISLVDLLAKRIGWLLENMCVNSQLMSLMNSLIVNPVTVVGLAEVLFGYLALGAPNQDGLAGLQGLLGRASNGAYFLDSSDSSVLVEHVMPSLPWNLRTYAGIVSVYGLRSDQVDVDEVILTILKTMCRQSVLVEGAVRPFVTDITVNCLRRGGAFSLNVVRYMFRLMGSGIKTTSSNRELGDLISQFLQFCVHKASVHQACVHDENAGVWLEIALTVPVRLKGLIPHFDECMSVMISALESSIHETVGVALTVLEAWVDGLTPDFLFPLICGNGPTSLVAALFALVRALPGPVHSGVSGNHAVRSTKILGKLGSKCKFHFNSKNVIGTKFRTLLACESTVRILALTPSVGVEVDIAPSVARAVSVLKNRESPPQQLADAFSLIAPIAAEGNRCCVLGLMHACVAPGLAERATEFALTHIDAQMCVEFSFVCESVSVLIVDKFLSVNKLPSVLELVRTMKQFETPANLLLCVLSSVHGTGVLNSEFGPDFFALCMAGGETVCGRACELLCGNATVADVAGLVRLGSKLNALKHILEKEAFPNLCDGGEFVFDFVAKRVGLEGIGFLLAWVDPGHVNLAARLTDGDDVFSVLLVVLKAKRAGGLDGLKGLDEIVNRVLEWVEKEDELRIIQTGGAAASYLLTRAVVAHNLCTIKRDKKIESALEILQLAVLGNVDLVDMDRVGLVFCRSLFSHDFQIVQLAYSVICGELRSKILGQHVVDQMQTVCLEIASRAPICVAEIQGLGRVVRCVGVGGAELTDRLFDRMQTYLAVLRERTYTPSGPISWRAGVASDSIVGLAAVTMECFPGGNPGIVEKLLSLTAQLEAALPGTCGSGQISSPFLKPLIASLCGNFSGEVLADQLLTRIELQKVFPIVAEMIASNTCLDLRKALQDKCHQMSVSDGSLMMRTAAASLVSVLARYDPTYLWIQHGVSSSGASSLIALLVRNWEATITAQSSAGTALTVLGSGGLVCAPDVCGFEGRIVAWTIMQFIQAPSRMAGLNVHVSDEIRVRLLIRLAASLSLKYTIEFVSSLEDWLVFEAPKLISKQECVELFEKCSELLQDPAVSVACKFAFVRYLLVPNWQTTHLHHPIAKILFAESTVRNIDEAIRVEILKLWDVSCGIGFVEACLGAGGVVSRQAVQLALLRNHLFIQSAIGGEISREFWENFSQCREGFFASFSPPVNPTGEELWWVVATGAVNEQTVCNLLLGKVAGKSLALSVGLKIAKIISKKDEKCKFLSNFFFKNGISDFGNNISPTLTAELINKCIEGLTLCGGGVIDASLIDQFVHLPRHSAPQPEVARHCRQLVIMNRLLNALVLVNCIDESLLCHCLGFSLISTGKSVCVSLCELVETVVARVSPVGDPTVSNSPVIGLLWKGIVAGLQVAANIGGKLILGGSHHGWPVTPYTAIAVLIACLRGVGRQNVDKWLRAASPFLMDAISQTSRSLVFSLLPQHLHEYCLSKHTNSAARVSELASAAAYSGNLQSPDLAVPSLLFILQVGRMCNNTEFSESIMWLIETLGPFVSLSGSNHQTFSHVLNALNFTVPQQSQKLSGAPHGSNNNCLAAVIPNVHLSALLRFCLTCLIGEEATVQIPSERKMSTHKLLLSASSALVGANALCAHMNVSGIVKSFSSLSTTGQLCRALVCFDGISILSPLSDFSVKKLLGFLPKRAVTSFPGSVLCENGMYNIKTHAGGLFALAAEALLERTDVDDCPEYLSALLLGSVCADLEIRKKFKKRLLKLVAGQSVQWAMSVLPWGCLGDRMFGPLLVCVLSAGADDRVGKVAPWFAAFAGILDGPLSVRFGRELCGVFGPQVDAVSFLTNSQLSKQSFFGIHSVCSIFVRVPNLPVPLLVHLARTCGLYFDVLAVLEESVPDEQALDAIETLYKDLNETDAFCGSLALRCATDSGSSAHRSGTDAFCMSVCLSHVGQERWESARLLIESEFAKGTPRKIMWDLWIESMRGLGDWMGLAEVVDEIPDPSLKLEILGKSFNDWGKVAELMSMHDWSDISGAKVYAAYLALSFSDSCHTGADAPTKQRLFLADMEASINRSYHQLVSEWNVLPDGFGLEKILLCQEFVEFNEASTLVADIRSSITGLRAAYPNPKQLLNSWRDRLPEKIDKIANWQELLNLRMIIFKHIQQQCSVDVVASSHIAPYLHDYPWTLVRFAQSCFSHNLLEMAQSLLSVKFQSAVSKSTDAFNQEIFDALCLQTKLYLKAGNAKDWKIGLNVLNSCAISNSNSQQASEISWMRGRLLAAVGDLDEAKAALELAVNAYPMMAGSWISLGDLAYDRGDSDEALMAYIQALSLNPQKSLRLVPRMLILARSSKVLADHPGSSSVWLGWVPTLIRCLREEGGLRTTCRSLLIKVGCAYPQAVVLPIQPLTQGPMSEIVGEILAQIQAGEPLFFSAIKKVFKEERICGSSTNLVEIPGNYTRYLSSVASSVKISSLKKYGESLVLVGNNGLLYTYDFVEGVGHPIGEQIYSVCNFMFDKYSQTRQRDVRVNCLQCVPIGPDTCLRERAPEMASFEAIYAGKQGGSEEETILVQFAGGSSPEEFYRNSYRFAKSFAATSMLDYLLGISALNRHVQNIWISKGAMFVKGLDFFCESKGTVAFRITPNVIKFIGQRNMLGAVPAVMRAVADAIHRKATAFTEYLELLSSQEEQDESFTDSFMNRLEEVVFENPKEITNLYETINQLIQESIDSSTHLTKAQAKLFLPGF